MSESYPKDSLDRFGDDLCEHLLSYLAVEDRYVLESVSKQFRRVIFATQTNLIIDKYFLRYCVSLSQFESIVRKCPQLAYIEFNEYPEYPITDAMVDLIVRHCDRVNAVHFLYYKHVSVGRIDTFFAKFAKQLLSIRVLIADSQLIPVFENILHNCVNAVDVSVSTRRADPLDSQLRPLFKEYDNYEVWYPRLKTFSLRFCAEDIALFQAFVDYYKTLKTFTSLSVTVDDRCDAKDVDLLVTGLIQMRELRDLEINCELMEYYVGDARLRALTSRLSELGRSCGQLKSLSVICGETGVRVVDDIIRPVSDGFRGLNRLYISGHFETPFVLRSEDLKKCRHLTHFSVEHRFGGAGGLTSDEFFENISRNVPKLRHLWLCVNPLNISVSALISLSKLPALQSVYLYGANGVTQETGDRMTDRFPKLQTIMIRDHYNGLPYG